MDIKNRPSGEEVQYSLEFPARPKAKYFPRSKRLFMLVCSTRRTDRK